MNAADVDYAVAWETANNYQLTLAFNGFYADAGRSADTGIHGQCLGVPW